MGWVGLVYNSCTPTQPNPFPYILEHVVGWVGLGLYFGGLGWVSKS